MKTLSLHQVSLVAALLLAGSLAASAQQAGYDLLQTQAGAEIELQSIPGFKPTHFKLTGVPICACTGGADTIMHRTEDVPASGKVNVEVVALFLKNDEPVAFQGQQVDVYLTVNHSNGVIGQDVVPQPDSLDVSKGWVTVDPKGTFTSAIRVVADVIVVPKGAKVTDPANKHQPGPPVNLQSPPPGSPPPGWSSTPSPGNPTACFFPANGFYPSGPIPEVAPSHRHPVAPTTPGATDLKIAKVTNWVAPWCAVYPSSPLCKGGPLSISSNEEKIPLPGISGQATLWTSTVMSNPGTPAAYLYVYRVDLRQAVSIGKIPPCIASVAVDFGPVSPFHYSGGPGLEQVFVNTKESGNGPFGTIAPVTAVQSGRTITFTFQPSVCAGGSPGKGNSSFLFGLVSAKPPKVTTATVTVAVGPPLSVPARAPQP